MSGQRNPYLVNTGLNIPEPASEATYATVTNGGGSPETEPKGNGTPQDTRPKRQRIMTDGKYATPKLEPLRLPKRIWDLLNPVLNESLEFYVTPDSVIAFTSESANMRLDAGFWVLIRLPPIQSDLYLPQGKTYKIKPISLAPYTEKP